eukprot:8662399-Ditylum_brightwellii.AAC.1
MTTSSMATSRPQYGTGPWANRHACNSISNTFVHPTARMQQHTLNHQHLPKESSNLFMQLVSKGQRKGLAPKIHQVHRTRETTWAQTASKLAPF